MTVEGTKTFFDWLVVILAGATFVSLGVVVITGNIINKRQAAQLREFNQGLTTARTELGRQQERTAKAEKAAFDAALALEKFKEPRILSPEQQEKLIATLKPFAGQHFACAAFPDPEPLALTRLLDTLAKTSGWMRVPSQIERSGGILMEIAGETAASIFDSGVTVYIAPDDQTSVPAQMALCSALMADGIHCETHRTPQLARKSPTAITIAVGKKP